MDHGIANNRPSARRIMTGEYITSGQMADEKQSKNKKVVRESLLSISTNNITDIWIVNGVGKEVEK